MSIVSRFVALNLIVAGAAAALGVPAALVPFLLAFSPLVIALALAWHEGQGALRRLLRSAIARPSSARWYLVLALPPLWALATVATTVVLGQSSDGLFDAVLPALVVMPFVVILPAFGEELGWRGFALPRLLQVTTPLAASLILAIPWTLIHGVLFLPGQWYEGLAIWPMAISIVAYSVILTWVYIGTGGSVLLTALFHTGLNGVAPLMSGIDPEQSWVIRNLLALAIAVAIVLLGGLTSSRREPAPTLTLDLKETSA